MDMDKPKKIQIKHTKIIIIHIKEICVMKNSKLQTVNANGEVLEESIIKVEEGNIITQRLSEGVTNEMAQKQHRFLIDALNNDSKDENNTIFYVEVRRATKKDEAAMLTLHKIDLDKGNSLIPAKTRAYSLKNLADFILEQVYKDKPKQIVFENAGLAIGLKDNFIALVKQQEDIAINEKGKLIYDGYYAQVRPQLYVGSTEIDIPAHVKYDMDVNNGYILIRLTNENTKENVEMISTNKKLEEVASKIQEVINMIK